jgi:hypothetical protein
MGFKTHFFPQKPFVKTTPLNSSISHKFKSSTTSVVGAF